MAIDESRQEVDGSEEMTEIIMISKDGCPQCANLARYLEFHEIGFKEHKIREDNAKDLSDLKTEYGFFGQALPALVVGHRVYEFNDIFAADGHIKDLGGILGP